MLRRIFKREWKPSCPNGKQLEGYIDKINKPKNFNEEHIPWTATLTLPDGQVVSGQGETKQDAISRVKMLNFNWCSGHGCFDLDGEGCFLKRTRKEG